ncbi:nitric oxide reductase transcriptional regulator NorR [Thalassotalea agariperforans]
MNDISSTALIELSLNLTKSLTSKYRFDDLISTIRKTIICEAVTMLAVKGDYLVPLALQGLSKDTLGRRFNIKEHPRLEKICQSKKFVRFPSDSDLPDPFDGLLISHDGDLPIHACMGLPLHFNDQLIGLLTLDSLTPGNFDNIPERTLELITAMASVSLNTALTLEKLELNIYHSQQVVTALSQPNVVVEQNELIGQSEKILHLKKEITLVASSQYNVLIQGESGSGKEIVAHEIHQQSDRNAAPIIYVNCAALPDNLIESELFGHVKGAFTGADKNREGKFVIADGGTLFLDEVGELPLTAQSKLLRAIQSNEIQAVGQDKTITVNVRIIAATNRDLQLEVKKGNFRADLFHRLNVYPINVPPLREREGDVALLTGFFIEKIKRKLGIKQLKTTPDVIQYLSKYHWPGNVRELEHLLSRAALKAFSKQKQKRIVTLSINDCDELHTDLAAPDLQGKDIENEINELTANNQHINLRQAVDDFQKNIITSALVANNNNWSATAKYLTLDRANLIRLAKRLNIYITKVIK